MKRAVMIAIALAAPASAKVAADNTAGFARTARAALPVAVDGVFGGQLARLKALRGDAEAPLERIALAPIDRPERSRGALLRI